LPSNWAQSLATLSLMASWSSEKAKSMRELLTLPPPSYLRRAIAYATIFVVSTGARSAERRDLPSTI
jgi:hypothetical protein